MRSRFLRLLSVVFVLFSIQSCSQQNKKEMDQKAKELLGNLYKDVKYVGKGASYHAVVSSGGATVEVYINGYPIHREPAVRSGSMGGSTPINECILKSGEQKVKIISHPIADKDDKMDEFMHPETYLDLKIKEAEWDEGSFIEKDPLLEYNTENDASISSATFSQKKIWTDTIL